MAGTGKNVILSDHSGKIRINVKGVNTVVDFVKNEKTGMGVASVDEDTRDAFLRIGKGYYKPESIIGENKNSEKEAVPPKSTKKENPGKDKLVLSEETFGQVVNVNQLKSVLKDCTDKELLLKLISNESQAEITRDSWVAALNGRLDELQNA